MNKEIEKYINEQTEVFKANLINKFKESEKEIGGNTYIPKDEEEYFFIDAGGVINTWYWSGDIEDEDGLAIGNVFKTRKEAEFEVERLKILAIMKKYGKPFELEKPNWSMRFDRYEMNIFILNSYRFDDGLQFYKDEETVQKVIDEIGEERLKKYYFRIEER